MEALIPCDTCKNSNQLADASQEIGAALEQVISRASTLLETSGILVNEATMQREPMHPGEVAASDQLRARARAFNARKLPVAMILGLSADDIVAEVNQLSCERTGATCPRMEQFLERMMLLVHQAQIGAED
jgi:hypothetical protein